MVHKENIFWQFRQEKCGIESLQINYPIFCNLSFASQSEMNLQEKGTVVIREI